MLTTAQKIKIRSYLGIPNRNINYNGVEWAINIVDSDADLETEVESILTNLTTIETAIASTYNTAGIKSAGKGDIEYFEMGTIHELRDRGRGYIQQLSVILGIEVYRDYFFAYSLPAGLINGFI